VFRLHVCLGHTAGSVRIYLLLYTRVYSNVLNIKSIGLSKNLIDL